MLPKPHGPALRISIVEDDDEIRAHLAFMLSNAEGFSVVSQHRQGEEAMNAILQAPSDVVLMDINLPGMSGIECARQLKIKLPALQILMLTIYEDADLIFESLKAGASGYLLKRTPAAKLMEAIREVHQGGSPMSSQVARKVVQYFNPPKGKSKDMERLSARESEVLDQLARGRLYKEIADTLGVSIDTVRKHLQSIYQKLHVHTRTEAVVKYLRN
jgi:DNA-binding NarL/FixJ family response regulator